MNVRIMYNSLNYLFLIELVIFCGKGYVTPVGRGGGGKRKTKMR